MYDKLHLIVVAIALAVITSGSVGQQLTSTTKPIFEVEVIELGDIPQALARRIKDAERAIDQDAPDERREIAERRLATLQEQADRARERIVLGRVLWWASADDTGPNSRGRHDRPVAVVLPGPTALAMEVSDGDFLMVHLQRAHDGGAGIAEQDRPYSDTQRVWKNVRVSKTGRPDWWLDAPASYSPLHLHPDPELTKQSGLKIVDVDGIVHYPARGRQGIYVYTLVIQNTGPRRISMASFVVNIVDEGGDHVHTYRHMALGTAAVTSMKVTNLNPGERTRIEVNLRPNMHLRYGSAELLCTRVVYDGSD